MTKVFIFSYYLPTQPLLEVPLYNELLFNGVDVNYVVMKNDPRLDDSTVSLPKSLIVIEKAKQINSMMKKEDLLICRFGYKGIIGDIASPVVSAGKRVLMYDVGGVDLFFRDVPATYLTAKTKWYKHQVLKKIKRKYKDIFSIGSIQMDDVFSTKSQTLDKQSFLKSYGLDPNKKLILLTPANPGEAYMDGIKDDYRSIVDIIGNTDYELMIKGHPSDYALIKSQHYQGKHSWEVFAPKIKVVKADEGYKALAVCDLVVNIRSSLAIEIPAFPKPLVNVNSHKYVVNWSKSDNPGVMNNIKISELGNFLKRGYYVDVAECEKYTKQFCDPFMDGKAYKRMADVILKLL